MKKLLLIGLGAISLGGMAANAQGKTALEGLGNPPQPTIYIQNYFTDESKKTEIANMQNNILKGCTTQLETIPSLQEDELDYYVRETKRILEERFSKSLIENPAIKSELWSSLDAIQADPKCYSAGNDCRERLLATAAYYYQNLRPNIPGCNRYVKYSPTAKNVLMSECEVELRLRNKVLENYGNANGGLNVAGAYTDTLIRQLNRTASDLSLLILHKNTGDFKYEKIKDEQNGKQVKRISKIMKDRKNVAICTDVVSGVGYTLNLRKNVYRELLSGVVPAKKGDKTPGLCVEEISVQYSEFVPVNFDEGSAALPQKSSEANKKDVDPVKAKIADFIGSHPDIQITNIDVTSSSSKTPFYKPNKVFDKDYSDKKNLELAQSRAEVAKRILTGMPGLAKAKQTTAGAITGPEFDEKDLKLREFVPGSSDYKALVAKFYAENQKLLAEDAMIKSEQELLDKNRFANLYEAKYKPYQGFKVVISGFSKAKRKCGDKDKATDVNTPVKTDVNESTSGKSQK